MSEWVRTLRVRCHFLDYRIPICAYDKHLFTSHGCTVIQYIHAPQHWTLRIGDSSSTKT